MDLIVEDHDLHHRFVSFCCSNLFTAPLFTPALLHRGRAERTPVRLETTGSVRLFHLFCSLARLANVSGVATETRIWDRVFGTCIERVECYGM